MTPARAWIRTSARRTTSSVTSTAGGWRRRRSPPTRAAGDRSSQLADAAEEQVRAIIEELAERVVAGEQGLGDDAMRIACLYASFMDEEAVEAAGSSRCGRCSTPSTACATSATWRRSSASSSRSAAAAPFGVYVDVDGKNSDRCLVNVVQGGLGLPDESYYHDEKFAEIREKYVAFLTRMFEPRRARRPGRRGRDRDGRGDPAVAGPLGARRDPRRAEDLQPPHRSRSCTRSARRSTGRPSSATSAARRRRSPRPASGSRRTSSTCRRPSRSCRSRTGAPGWPPASSAPTRRTSPASSSRPTSTSTAAPSAARRAARALEARRRAGRGLDRRGGRPGVRRPPLPARLQGDDGGAGRQPAAGLPASPSRRWTG